MNATSVSSSLVKEIAKLSSPVKYLVLKRALDLEVMLHT